MKIISNTTLENGMKELVVEYKFLFFKKEVIYRKTENNIVFEYKSDNYYKQLNFWKQNDIINYFKLPTIK